MAEAGAIPGYGFGAQETARSPLDLEDLDLLKQTVLFTDEDQEYLRLAGDVLEDQLDEVLDLWYGFVGSHPRLIRYFADRGVEPNARYLERVRERFKRWVLDTCRRPYDQQWLDYQQEIALLHARQEEPDRRSTGDPGAHPVALPGRLRLPDHGDHQAVPRQGGPLRRRGREDARRLVQVGNAAGRPVGSTVLEGRGFLAWG